jgi:tetratricopeptide (TPR) repeat protein
MAVRPFLSAASAFVMLATAARAEPWRGPAVDGALPDAVKASLARADALYASRDKDGNDAKAASELRSVVKTAPGSFDAWWRLSRAVWWLGERTSDETRLRPLSRECREAAETAVKLRPNAPEGLYFGALCIGSYSRAAGLFTALREGLEAKFRDPLVALAKSTPAMDNAGVFNALGRYKFTLPWPKRDYDESVAHLERALELQPVNLRGRVYLAETLAARDRVGDLARARRLLAEVLAAPVGRYDTAEELHAQGLARALSGRTGLKP